jgi:hypothetical protein
MQHGMIIGGENPMQKNIQRPLNSSMHRDKIGRDGRVEKRLVDAPPVPGQKRQTKGEMGYHHGTVTQDEPMTTKTSDASRGPISIHPGMTKRQVDDFHSKLANHSAVILQDGANLGKPPSKA